MWEIIGVNLDTVKSPHGERKLTDRKSRTLKRGKHKKKKKREVTRDLKSANRRSNVQTLKLLEPSGMKNKEKRTLKNLRRFVPYYYKCFFVTPKKVGTCSLSKNIDFFDRQPSNFIIRQNGLI